MTEKARQATEAERYIALLRGINVGGRNKLPMSELSEMFSSAGCDAVKTYIQSGNVVFHAAAGVAEGLPQVVSRRIAKTFGYDLPVVLRSASEMAAVARGNPFLQRGEDEKALHVLFLADRPTASRVAALDARRSPPDEFQVRGREVFLFCPHGVADTRLTNAYFDSKLGTVSTGRNWRTVLKLIELSAS